MKVPLRSSRGSGDLSKNVVGSPKQSPIVTCSKQIAASISFPKQLSQFAQSLVIKGVSKSGPNDTKNQLNKSQHTSSLVAADKISPRRKPFSDTKTAKKLPRVNASTSAFEQKQLGAISNEQVIIEPEIPVPNAGGSIVTLSSSSAAINFGDAKDTKSQLIQRHGTQHTRSHAKSVSDEPMSRSSAAVVSSNRGVNDDRQAVRTMAATPALTPFQLLQRPFTYHAKPQMVQPSQKYEFYPSYRYQAPSQLLMHSLNSNASNPKQQSDAGDVLMGSVDTLDALKTLKKKKQNAMVQSQHALSVRLSQNTN